MTATSARPTSRFNPADLTTISCAGSVCQVAKSPVRRRLDADLVRRGLVPSRQQAHELIVAGRVTVSGAPALKPSRLVRRDEPVLVLGGPPRYVSRGGQKLAAALSEMAVPVEGVRALDAGASTGGFTDCLLQHGAREVVAVDVGHGQLHERLRADSRVEVRDRTNVRQLRPGSLGDPFDVVVADLSFISLGLIVPNLLALAKPGAHLVVLVKPQFEAGRTEAARGRGVVRDPAVWRQALEQVIDALAGHGATIMEGMMSPVRGADGNVEFLLHAVARGSNLTGVTDIEALIDRLLAQAVEPEPG